MRNIPSKMSMHEFISMDWSLHLWKILSKASLTFNNVATIQFQKFPSKSSLVESIFSKTIACRFGSFPKKHLGLDKLSENLGRIYGKVQKVPSSISAKNGLYWDAFEENSGNYKNRYHWKNYFIKSY